MSDRCPACGQAFEVAPGAAIPYPCSRCGSRVIGPYCDLQRVGGGAMGDVYRARHPALGSRWEAIKIPKSVTEQLGRRFEREIAASARLCHENIVRVFARGEVRGVPFLTMEFVEGRSLHEVVQREHPLPVGRVLRILRGLAAGLAHAAKQQIVNRDLKPENILLTAEDTPKILDYGLALIRELDERPDRVTRQGVLLGTTAYMAPEQAADPHGVTMQADVYALGCSAYYALSATTPFHGDTREICRGHASAPRPSVRTVRTDVPAELDQLVQRMMAIAPELRPTPAQLLHELDVLVVRHPYVPPPAPLPEAAWLDVACPECGEKYHLRPNSVGQWIICTNPACGGRFKVHASGTWAEPPPTLGPDETPPLAPGEEVVIAGQLLEEPPSPPSRLILEEEPSPAGPAVTPWAGSRGPGLESQATGPGPEYPATYGPPSVWADSQAEPPPITGVAIEPGEPVLVSPALGGSPSDVPVLTGVILDQPIPGSPASSVVAPPVIAPLVGTQSSAGAETAVTRPAGSPKLGPAPPPPPPAPAPTPATTPAKRRRMSPRTRFILVAGTVLAACIAVVLFVPAVRDIFFPPPPDPDQIWAQLQEDYQLRKWKRVEEALRKFGQDFPEHPRAAEVPFFLDMCLAGREIFSDAGDMQKGLAQLQQIFLKYRDTKEYEAYCADLYMALVRLIERLVDQGKKRSDPNQLDRAREAFELLTTVAQAMKDDWVPGRTAKVRQEIDDTQRLVAVVVAQREILAATQRAQDRSTPAAALDGLYESVDRRLAQFKKLTDDKDVRAAVDAMYKGEAGRVTYVREQDTGEPPVAAPDQQADTVFIVWNEPTGPAAAPANGETHIAIAHGVLYVFDGQGRHRWSRRLGIDSYRRPIELRPSATSPDAFLAVSTLDNTLLALEKATGQVLWRYPAGSDQDLFAPLTVSRWKPDERKPDEMVRGLLPTASGEVHVLELATGKRMGRFQTGFPMTVGGTYDPATQLAFFPADRQRVFALDPAVIEDPTSSSAPARAVLFSGHPSGALRSPPAVVGQYLIVAQAADLDATQIRAFQILPRVAFFNPKAAPLAEKRLRGWAWFSPPATPDRITVVTDQGELGVCGLNLDNPAEALFWLIQDGNDRCPSLAVSDPYRALAIHSDEHLLWVMAGGVLRHLALDVLHQKVATVWPAKDQPATVTGIPLHEAARDRSGRRLFVTVDSPRGDETEFVAVDAATGQRAWSRQLGIHLAADPLPQPPQGMLLLDRTGRLASLLLDPAAPHGGLRVVTDPSPRPAGGGDLLQIRDLAGQPWLVLPLGDGKRLALRPLLGNAGPATWREVALPDGRLQGRPALIGPHLVVPCSDGRLHRLRWDGQSESQLNALPFTWTEAGRLAATDVAEVYPLAERAVLLADGVRFRWLEFTEQEGVRQWKPRGAPFLAPAPLATAPLVHEDALYVATADNSLFRLSRRQPEPNPPQWAVDGRITSAPWITGQHLLVIRNDREVVCYDLDGAAKERKPQWISAPLTGRICGCPQDLGDRLLVTDESGQVTVLGLEDGRPQLAVSLGPGVIPAAAAVPFGKNRLLVPLVDGTLLWYAVKRTPEKQVAKAGP